MEGPTIARECLNCGDPIPADAFPTRLYCTSKCRKQYNRHKNGARTRPRIRIERGYHAPNPGTVYSKDNPERVSTGDPDVDKILNLPYEATLRVTLLKELLDRKKTQWQREALEKDQKARENTVLDPSTAHRIARILAQQNYTPGTGTN